MSSRRDARECALQMLFQWDVGRDSPDKVEELFWATAHWIDDESVRSFANGLFRETVKGIQSIDQMIRAHAQHWRLERMPVVDRNLIRMAICELRMHPDTPPAVVISEALEIAKKFSSEDSAQFVNGVLDHVRKELAASSSWTQGAP